MALSMRERLALQKSVKQSLATLRGGEVGMRERLALQKQVKADMAKLGGTATPKESGPEPVTRDNTSVGDAVEWRNEMGTIAGNFRGITDDGRHAVIVHDGGMQSSAPLNEVFKASEEAAPVEAPAHERIKAAIQGGDASEAMRIAQTLTDKLDLSEALVKAGFSIAGGSVGEMLAYVWPQMQDKAGQGGGDAGQPKPEEAQPSSPNSLTAQAARGDFNGLALPEFIEKLKSAYSADEDLDGAKEAAIGYLEANQEELEAA